MSVVNRTNLFLAAAAVSQLVAAEQYSAYEGGYCTGAKAAELYKLINNLRKQPDATTRDSDENYYVWSTMHDFLSEANNSVSTWEWIKTTTAYSIASSNSVSGLFTYPVQPVYVGIPRTSFTWDLQKKQLRYAFWEDYNPTRATSLASATVWNSEVVTPLGSAALGDLKWKEGLAKAAHYKNDRWLDCKTYSRCFNNYYIAPIMPDGTSPFMRAEMFGTVTGTKKQVLEYSLYEVEEMFYVLAMMLIDDRSKYIWGSRVVQAAVLNDLTNYKSIGIAHTVFSKPKDLYLNKTTDTLTTVVFASDYTNNADVETCQPVQSFGGGACDPDSSTIDLFNLQNEFRVNPVATDRLKGRDYSNEFVGTPTSKTVTRKATYKLNKVLQRISDLGESQYWSATGYNVYAWDINADNDWHGSKSEVAGDLAAESEYFIYPHSNLHFQSLKQAIVHYFIDGTSGLD